MTGPHGYAVYANGDTGLDHCGPPAAPGRGVIDARHALGWGIFPFTDAGLAEAREDAADWNRAAEEFAPGAIGDGPDQVPAATVVTVDADGRPITEAS